MTEEEIKNIEDAAFRDGVRGGDSDIVFLGKICIKLHKRILELEKKMEERNND